MSLRDAIGELSRTSGRAAKLPPPALATALADARREPLKQAVIKAKNSERFAPIVGPFHIETSATNPPPTFPPPGLRPQVESSVGVIERTIRIYVDSYPDMDAASIGEALSEVWERIQDVARKGLSEARP